MVTHTEMVELAKKELMEFPELARRYLIYIMLLLLELRKFKKFFINSCALSGKFEKSAPFRQAALKEMDETKFSALYLSIINTVIMAKEFTDTEADEFRATLIALDPNSLRNYLISKGAQFVETFSYLNNREDHIWTVMNQHIDITPSTSELFCVSKSPLLDMNDFFKKKVNEFEDLKFYHFSPESSMIVIASNAKWKYRIFANKISEAGTIISVSE